MAQASTVLWQTFLQGPVALAGLDEAVFTDRIALEDINTGVGALEGNVALEGLEPDELQLLHLLAARFRGKLASGDNLDPQAVRVTLSDLQKGFLRLPQDKRERPLARVRRPIFATSFAYLRLAILATLGAGNVELTDAEARNLDDQLLTAVEDGREVDPFFYVVPLLRCNEGSGFDNYIGSNAIEAKDCAEALSRVTKSKYQVVIRPRFLFANIHAVVKVK